MTNKLAATAGLALMAATLAAFAPPPVAMPVQAEPGVTVIHKTNPHWPVKGLIATDPCQVRTCHAV